MSDIDLEKYLETIRAQGKADGEGHFTISQDVAARKIVDFILPRENAWVLYFVQAAVEMGCDRLVLTRSRTGSIFHFKPGSSSSFPNAEALANAIIRADFKSFKPEDKLGAALRLLVDKLNQSFLLYVETGSGVSQSLFAGHYYGGMGEKKRANVLQEFGLGLTIAVHHVPHSNVNRFLLRYLPFKNLAAGIVDELATYAFTSSIPVEVNSTRIDGLLKSDGLQWSPFRKPLWIFPLSVTFDSSPRTIRFSQHSGRRVFRLNAESIGPDEDQDRNEQRQAILVLGAEFSKPDDLGISKQRSQLHWLQSGVVVETEMLDSKTRHLSLDVFVNSEGLHSDLSGFALIRDADYLHRKARVLAAARKALKQEVPSRAEMTSHPPFDLGPERPGPDDYAKIELLYRDEVAHLAATLADMVQSAERVPKPMHPKFWRPPQNKRGSDPFGL